VDSSFAQGRLTVARAYLKAARDELTLAAEQDIGNPAISQIVIAAIAYTDAPTARYGGRVNRKDHAAAVKALRKVLGNRLPAAQQSRLQRILREKDTAQYGSRPKTKAEAAHLLGEVEALADWAEAELARKP
jgi:hypothetical protein